MKVSTTEPFQIIYSLFQHEYLGYLFESFVVQLDQKGRLTFSHQNISHLNAKEFASGLDEVDYELIEIMDSMQQEQVVKHFNRKRMKPEEFFFKVYDDNKKSNELLQKEIHQYLERRRAEVLKRMSGKMLFEMGNDGEPAWKQIDVLEEKATVLFHFRRNEENTHYFPTIKQGGEKVEFQYNGAYLICHEPAYMILDHKLYSFEKEVDGKKLKPFLNKKFIAIPKDIEETYFKKFVAPLVASFDVYAKGFEIKTERYEPVPILTFAELATSQGQSMDLFGKEDGGSVLTLEEEGKIVFDLQFRYGSYVYKRGLNTKKVSVSVEKSGDDYTFHRMVRDTEKEQGVVQLLHDMGLALKQGKFTEDKSKAFSWINTYREVLKEHGVELQQKSQGSKRYFVGKSSIDIEIKENIDWFDIHAVVRFGEFEIPFKQIRHYILKKQHEFELPNGEIAVIPSEWFTEYTELFAFAEESQHNLQLKKHHVALVQDMEEGQLARVSINQKLRKLKDFQEIEDSNLPKGFEGALRPYQKAGFNWLQFLNNYSFGGCLADDMGLGKTVQTLAMLQAEKELGHGGTTLLIMPTSLIYNWEEEARKFTPWLKVFTYTGTTRKKDVSQFEGYDLVLTSYGITRLDIDILQDFYFNYVILDESQAIKNPDSHIAKAVKKLNSRRRLILTGTPIENSTLDLWSQMSFVNPGLLGNKSFFKNEFLNPIEKHRDEKKIQKLYTIIKPFILRRQKSQVATELPEKVENVHYSDMTTRQEEEYEEVKSFYRNKIMDQIELKGMGGSQMLLLQGLTKLRQIANHPKMVDTEYDGTSGKMEDVMYMLENTIDKGHKILVFSQFVKHLSLIREKLDKMGVQYAYLDGTTKDRKKEVARFQKDKETQLFLISLKAGGLGLNLTEADYVFLLDPWWNPAIEAQAVDRAHRIGQVNKVFTYKFITKNSVEEKILALQQKKVNLARELITTEESFVKSLTKTDIESILA